MNDTNTPQAFTNEAANVLLAKLYTAFRNSSTEINKASKSRSPEFGGIKVWYCQKHKVIWADIHPEQHILIKTDTPSDWALNGRKNWRAIKSAVDYHRRRLKFVADCVKNTELRRAGVKVPPTVMEPAAKPEKAPRKPKAKPEPIQLPPEVEAVQIPPAAIDGLPDDWQKAIPEGLMTSKEAKAQLKTAGNKKGEPKPSLEVNHAPSESVTPAASRSAADILKTFSGSAKSESKRAPQQHRANKRRPR